MDFHIHSTFSDGAFSVSTIVAHARRKGIREIAITDHYLTSKVPSSLAPQHLEGYLDALDKAVAGCDGGIICLKGLEINTLDLFLSNTQLLPADILRRFDFILFEYISDKPMQGIPLIHLEPILKTLPVPAGLAHTDLVEAFPHQAPEVVIQRLESSGVFIELNESYSRPGSHIPFYFNLEPYFLAAKGGTLRFTVGSDMHHDLNRLGSAYALRYLESLGLKEQIADSTYFRALRQQTTRQQHDQRRYR